MSKVTLPPVSLLMWLVQIRLAMFPVTGLRCWESECPTQLVDIVISEYCPSTETLGVIAVTEGWYCLSTSHIQHQVDSDGLYNLLNPRSQTWRNLFLKPSTGLEKTCLSYHVIIVQLGITSLHFQRSYPRIREQSPWTEWATRGSSPERPEGFTEWTLSRI